MRRNRFRISLKTVQRFIKKYYLRNSSNALTCNFSRKCCKNSSRVSYKVFSVQNLQQRSARFYFHEFRNNSFRSFSIGSAQRLFQAFILGLLLETLPNFYQQMFQELIHRFLQEYLQGFFIDYICNLYPKISPMILTTMPPGFHSIG